MKLHIHFQLLSLLISISIIAIGANISISTTNAEVCLDPPRSLRVISNDNNDMKLIWQAPVDCDLDNFLVYRYTDSEKELIAVIDVNTSYYTDTNVPTTGKLSYLVRGINDGRSTTGVQYVIREGNQNEIADAEDPQEDIPQLVCVYSLNNEIHTITGLRECTINEILHRLNND